MQPATARLANTAWIDVGPACNLSLKLDVGVPEQNKISVIARVKFCKSVVRSIGERGGSAAKRVPCSGAREHGVGTCKGGPLG